MSFTPYMLYSFWTNFDDKSAFILFYRSFFSACLHSTLLSRIVSYYNSSEFCERQHSESELKLNERSLVLSD